MLWNLLALVLIIFPQEKELGKLIGKFESSIRTQNLDSVRYYYSKLRSTGKDRGDYIGLYINGFTIFKMLTADSFFKNHTYLDSAIYYLEKCIATNPDFSDAYALLGSLYGLKALTNLSKVVQYGKKSTEYFEKAKMINPENPRVYYLEGIGLFFRPKSFGGGKEKALSSFKKAIEFYQKEKDNPLSWGYLDCMAFLGFAFEELGEKENALKVYGDILEIEPNYKWVKERVEKLRQSGGK
ncbi:MAG: hypothetical protein ABIM42_03860 [candidate division WOR-3 bacterium]